MVGVPLLTFYPFSTFAKIHCVRKYCYRGQKKKTMDEGGLEVFVCSKLYWILLVAIHLHYAVKLHQLAHENNQRKISQIKNQFGCLYSISKWKIARCNRVREWVRKCVTNNWRAMSILRQSFRLQSAVAMAQCLLCASRINCMLQPAKLNGLKIAEEWCACIITFKHTSMYSTMTYSSPHKK